MRISRWSANYVIGVEEVDREHQSLFATLDRLDDAIRNGDAADVVTAVIERILDYTIYHFAHEEELMGRIKYPFLDDHRREHNALREQINSMRSRAEKGDPAIGGELLEFLTAWLRCHTTTTDRRIGSYMRSHGLVS